MKIEVEKLSAHAEPFDVEFESRELEYHEEERVLKGALHLTGAARKSGAGVQINAQIAGQVEAACDRCGRVVELNINEDFETLYVTATHDLNDDEERELAAADLLTEVFDGATIDMREAAREQLLLAVDVRVLCAEDCQGICPRCAANLNDTKCGCVDAEIDPRWAKLKAILDDDKT